MKCKHCNSKERTISVWPWVCSCGMVYRSADDSGAMRRPSLSRKACQHLGDEVRRVPCQSCRGNVQVKVFGCEMHGECTLQPVPSMQTCGTCSDYSPRQFAPITTRNCIYHVCPLAENDVWRRNVRQLLKRQQVFNGKKVVAIACGPGMEPPAVVKAEFAGSGFEFLELPNDPELREVATFLPLLEAVANTNENEATWFAHTKGNSTTGNREGAMRWRNAMYHHLLDRADECLERLREHAAAGTHKMIYGRPERAPYPNGFRHGIWMFAGTFFWFRHDQVFTHPKWRDVPCNRYGAEAWLSGLFAPDDVYSMFQPWNEKKYPTANPYQPELYSEPITDADTIGLRIGFDLDQTIYGFPHLFREIIPALAKAGHKIYCTSNHSQQTWKETDEQRLRSLGIDPALFDISLMRQRGTNTDGPANKARMAEHVDLVFDDFDVMNDLTKTPVFTCPHRKAQDWNQ
jgi:hypothetical protein